MQPRQIHEPTHFDDPPLEKASIKLDYCRRSVKDIYDVFIKIREAKGKKRRTLLGVTTDQEQDLLRSMFLFSASGIDAVVKQLIDDALEKVIMIDIGAGKEFEKFVERQLKKESSIDLEGDSFQKTGIKLMARALASPDSQKVLIQARIADLNKGSMQSKERLLEVSAGFGIETKDLGVDIGKLDLVFGVRNEISHEMDILLDGKNRKRRQRSQTNMVRDTNLLLETAEKIIEAVKRKLNKD